ncbi:hypothetical protein H4219_006244 [Mycoemilia scoparia]|uniref:Uncharacterized protein n=1 Tax=Mycoemilia scoparia TaxID=417184 RepID=A0A9W7ZKC3_9FUNG|nr:hypothetical protein H4219_006244 [Mycoemilia scoparia]
MQIGANKKSVYYVRDELKKMYETIFQDPRFFKIVMTSVYSFSSEWAFGTYARDIQTSHVNFKEPNQPNIYQDAIGFTVKESAMNYTSARILHCNDLSVRDFTSYCKTWYGGFRVGTAEIINPRSFIGLLKELIADKPHGLQDVSKYFKPRWSNAVTEGFKDMAIYISQIESFTTIALSLISNYLVRQTRGEGRSNRFVEFENVSRPLLEYNPSESTPVKILDGSLPEPVNDNSDGESVFYDHGFSMAYYAGYLTMIPPPSPSGKNCYIAIPNHEMLFGWFRCINIKNGFAIKYNRVDYFGKRLVSADASDLEYEFKEFKSVVDEFKKFYEQICNAFYLKQRFTAVHCLFALSLFSRAFDIRSEDFRPQSSLIRMTAVPRTIKDFQTTKDHCISIALSMEEKTEKILDNQHRELTRAQERSEEALGKLLSKEYIRKVNRDTKFISVGMHGDWFSVRFARLAVDQHGKCKPSKHEYHGNVDSQ